MFRCIHVGGIACNSRFAEFCFANFSSLFAIVSLFSVFTDKLTSDSFTRFGSRSSCVSLAVTWRVCRSSRCSASRSALKRWRSTHFRQFYSVILLQSFIFWVFLDSSCLCSRRHVRVLGHKQHTFICASCAIRA